MIALWLIVDERTASAKGSVGIVRCMSPKVDGRLVAVAGLICWNRAKRGTKMREADLPGVNSANTGTLEFRQLAATVKIIR